MLIFKDLYNNLYQDNLQLKIQNIKNLLWLVYKNIIKLNSKIGLLGKNKYNI